MWGKISQWHQQMDDDAMLVLETPEAADSLPAGMRRYVGTRLATMSPIERQQFRAFLVKYHGIRFYVAAAKLLLPFTALGALQQLLWPGKLSWAESLVLSNLIGFSLACGLMGVWFNYRKLVANRSVKPLLRILLACVVGLLFGMGASAIFSDKPMVVSPEKIAANVGIALLVVSLLYIVPLGIVAIWRNRQFETMSLQLQQEAERERLARELSESQLRLLRAQIEPHFLFNTLGAVQQLAEQGAPRAAALTADLIAFLRASLAEMRSEQVPLQSEFDMVAAYLRVMQARMGQRLRFRLDLPAPLAHVMVPSMIVLTLAENAIKHGIEPALRGGDIHISAEQVDGMLRLRVQDTGVGLGGTVAGTPVPAPGGGLGLENVRSRLQLSAQQGGGAAGRLELREGEEGGVVADILLPRYTETKKEGKA
ncbi:sensor histidine kinase [Janthinobacterium sp. AD80]|uniref:sensor histidine kinase n=1 Tax=unclassified Janthinobacterium TaxID=2610881 RepID=UPI000C8426CC|nr:histidine kinase [Janthinobacterium sp. AD80]PMQ16686.1 Sensor histidine kinase YpdA [Janthinobacterium sp. AD80]